MNQNQQTDREQNSSDDPDSRLGRRVVVAGGVAAVGVAAAALTGASPTAWAKPIIKSAIGIPAAAASGEPSRPEFTMVFLGGTLTPPDYGPTTIILSLTNTGNVSTTIYDLEWMNAADGSSTLTFDTTLTEAQFEGTTYPVANAQFNKYPTGTKLPGYQQVSVSGGSDVFLEGETVLVAFQLSLAGTGTVDSAVQVISRYPYTPQDFVWGLASLHVTFTPPALSLTAYGDESSYSAVVGSYPLKQLRVQALSSGSPFKGARITYTVPEEFAGLASFDGSPTSTSVTSATGVAFMPRVLFGPDTGTATIIASSADSESEVALEVTSTPPVDGSVLPGPQQFSLAIYVVPYTAGYDLAAVRYLGGARPAVAVPVITVSSYGQQPRFPAGAPITISVGDSPYVELVQNGVVVDSATGCTYRDAADAPFETSGQRMHAAFDGFALRATDAVANDLLPGAQGEFYAVIDLDPQAGASSIRVTYTND